MWRGRSIAVIPSVVGIRLITAAVLGSSCESGESMEDAIVLRFDPLFAFEGGSMLLDRLKTGISSSLRCHQCDHGSQLFIYAELSLYLSPHLPPPSHIRVSKSHHSPPVNMGSTPGIFDRHFDRVSLSANVALIHEIVKERKRSR